jgi:hypothetical protein
MNEGKQHINQWAEKLQDISLPDESLSWDGMFEILDNELPQAKKKDYSRWALLVILMLLLLGVCNCPNSVRNGLFNTGNTDTLVNAKKQKNEMDTRFEASDTTNYVGGNISTIGNDSTSKDNILQSSRIIKNGKLVTSDTVAFKKNNVTGNGIVNGQNVLKNDYNSAPKPILKNTVNTSGKNQINTGRKGSGIADVSRKNRGTVGSLDSSYGSANDNKIVRRKKQSKNSDNVHGGSDAKMIAGRNASATNSNVDSGRKIVAKPIAGGRFTSLEDDVLHADSALGKYEEGDQQITKDSIITIDSVKKNNVITNKDSIGADSAATKKEKMDKEKSKENGWAAAVGLNQFFAIGGQERSTLNSDGITGTWKDYLPVPQLRYYFNRKLYAQLEAQFNAPQYTRSLLGKFVPADTNSISTQTSVYVKKLFYFNLPLSIHYSPIKNVYIGTGIQFSRLSNGVGTFEEKLFLNGIPDSSLADIKTQSLKGDSLYQRIATNEFRWLVDANYHLKNFTIGARYNQAFSNFINIQISSTQLTQARNSSLQLYLRYTLWRSKKLKASGIY